MVRKAPKPAAGAAAVLSRVRKFSNGDPKIAREDWIAAEAPLEVHIGGKPTTVLMRTPGHDEELVTGFLFNEGIIASAADIASIGHIRPARGQAAESVIGVELNKARKASTVDRLFYSNSSCGVCGKKTIASLEVRGPIADTHLHVSRLVLESLPDR